MKDLTDLELQTQLSKLQAELAGRQKKAREDAAVRAEEERKAALAKAEAERLTKQAKIDDAKASINEKFDEAVKALREAAEIRRKCGEHIRISYYDKGPDDIFTVLMDLDVLPDDWSTSSIGC